MTNNKKSVIIFIFSMLIFGTVGVIRRFVPFSSAFLAFSRGILGGLFLLTFVRIKKRNTVPPLSAHVLVRLVFVGAMIGINWIFLFEAYNHTTVAVATLCYYMQPTIVMLLSPLVFKERLTLKKAICAAVSIAGMILISDVMSSSDRHSGDLYGILFGLAAALFYASVVIMNKRIPDIDPYQRTTVLLLSAGLVMLPYLLLTNGFSIGKISLSAVVLLFVLGFVHTGVAYTMYFSGMDGLRVQTIAVLSYIDPVSALLFSAILLREPLSLPDIIGAILIIGSAMVSEFQQTDI